MNEPEEELELMPEDISNGLAEIFLRACEEDPEYRAMFLGIIERELHGLADIPAPFPERTDPIIKDAIRCVHGGASARPQPGDGSITGTCAQSPPFAGAHDASRPVAMPAAGRGGRR